MKIKITENNDFIIEKNGKEITFTQSEVADISEKLDMIYYREDIINTIEDNRNVFGDIQFTDDQIDEITEDYARTRQDYPNNDWYETAYDSVRDYIEYNIYEDEEEED